MATNTTFPATKAYLRDELRKIKALRGVQVEYGYPGETIEKQCIWLAGVDGSLSVPTMMAGRHSRDEDYAVTILIDVLMQAGTVEEAERKACDFFDAIDNFIAEDLTLDRLVQAAMIADFNVQTVPSSQGGAASRIAFTLRVSNRLN